MKCSCGNEDDFYMVWEDVTVIAELHVDGTRRKEVDQELRDEDGYIECAICRQVVDDS